MDSDKGFTSTLKLNGWCCFPPEPASAKIPFNGKWQETIYPPPQPVLTEHSNLVLEEIFSSWVNLSCSVMYFKIFSLVDHVMYGPKARGSSGRHRTNLCHLQAGPELRALWDVSVGFGQCNGFRWVIQVKWTNGYGFQWDWSFEWDFFHIFLSEPFVKEWTPAAFPFVRSFVDLLTPVSGWLGPSKLFTKAVILVGDS